MFCNFLQSLTQNVTEAIAKSRIYLESKIPDMTDTFDLAIVSLALKFVDSPEADATFAKLPDAIEEGNNGAFTVNFRQNFIFTNSIKRHICHIKHS